MLSCSRHDLSCVAPRIVLEFIGDTLLHMAKAVQSVRHDARTCRANPFMNNCKGTLCASVNFGQSKVLYPYESLDLKPSLESQMVKLLRNTVLI